MNRAARAAAIMAAALCVGLAGCVVTARSGEPPAASVSASPSGQSSATGQPSASVSGEPVTFAIIGDYGRLNRNEAGVARLVASWDPAYIITVGDDYYRRAGGVGTAKYDRSTGTYYCRWLADVTTSGTRCGSGEASVNAFFPAMGNHDYSDATPAPATYLSYFHLPGKGLVNTSGNERYYDFVQGQVHFFVLNSNAQEPDGTSRTSAQAAWLKTQLARSTSTWNIVYDHHPPYSSDSDHGSSTQLRWPFAKWGADAVISGHAHTYERVMAEGIVYFVNGLGGADRYSFGVKVPGSVVRYNANWGAQKVSVTDEGLRFEFYNVAGKRIDTYTVDR